MSGTTTKQTLNLASNKRRSLSGQGGLFNRMFGSSNGNGKDSTALDTTNLNNTTVSSQSTDNLNSPGVFLSQEDGTPDDNRESVPSDLKSPARKGSDTPSTSGDKKRRSSGVGRARDLFSSAKQSLSNFANSPEHRNPPSPQTPMQKLSKTDPALSVPQGSHNNSAGESSPSPRSTFRVGVTEDKNKKCRRTMEDTHAYLYNFMSTPAPALTGGSLSKLDSRDSMTALSSASSNQDIVETDNGYFAIFDGHAGTFAADWCGKKVHILLEDIIRKNPNTPIPELLDMTFTSADQQLEKLPLKNSGCTAVCAVLRWEDRIPNSQSATGSTAIAPAAAAAAKEQTEETQGNTTEAKLREAASRQRVLYTANVGDARIVLCRNGKALRLSYDHKGSDENEGKRIAGAGGLILNNRVNGVLAVTRALGDAYMKELVTGHPYTTETVIQPDIDEFLILACDGLWDVCSDQEAVDLVRNIHDPQAASKALVEHALARFSTDNLSCMLVRFDNKTLQETVGNKLDPIGVEGDAASHGLITESQAIVANSKRMLEENGVDSRTRIPSDLKEEPEPPEPGPELSIKAAEAARKDKASDAPVPASA
ncbi:hypothetical protein AMS68_000882 [Peltaster fructicola]|uniref:PPM-type phosphatase domain-containing protein n=1 Tax=Peltaster fructicola TaxID=286661 RepID=A0A6H0XL61_9PEZI|nr:hypothetical protein AMS68_000882 [Peltaster fructicola]